MTLCNTCSGDMRAVFTCLPDVRRGVVPFGGELLDAAGLPETPPFCHDCSVAQGGLHHPGCCVAWCEPCNAQRLICGCDEGPEDDD